MNILAIVLAVWWLYGTAGTYVLGTQVGGDPLRWLMTGVLLGPVGMVMAIIIPAIRGRYPAPGRPRWTTFAFTFGLLVLSEFIVHSGFYRSAMFSVFL